MNYNVVDGVATFWRFLSLCGGVPTHERVALFRNSVVQAHESAYGVALDLGDPAIAAYLLRTETRLSRLRRMQTAFPGLLQRHWSQFAAAAPGLDEDADIYLLPAPSHAIGGAVRRFGSRDAIVFGTDQLDRLRGRDINLSVFFHHELAHLYHAQMNDEMRSASINYFLGDRLTPPARLYQILWLEGFATYVSGCIVPLAETSDLLSSPTVASAIDARRERLAVQLLQAFDTEDRAIIDNFVFWGDPTIDVPPRAGYALGLMLARRLAATSDIANLARLEGDQLRSALRRAMVEFAEGKLASSNRTSWS